MKGHCNTASSFKVPSTFSEIPSTSIAVPEIMRE